MKKVININFHGRVIPIEETAFDQLKQYTDSLRNYFADEEGRDEIINDIENRIAELFDERIKNGATCITEEDLNVILNNMGRPQDFADADANAGTGASTESKQQDYVNTPFTSGKRLYRDENSRLLGGVCSGIAAYFNIEPIIVRLVFIFSGIGFIAYLLLWAFVPGSNTVQNGVKKRLYRNPDNKFIAGVCSGLASYFNVNVWIPRILFLLPFISFIFRMRHLGPFGFPNFLSFSFSPGSFIIYIILWMVLPEANTTSEKLEMKGEKVDLNSIKNTVVEEMKGVKDRVGKAGAEARVFVQDRSGNVKRELGSAARRTGSSLGDIIAFIAKMFAYFIVGCVALSLVVALFALAIVSIGLFPLKNYILTGGTQNALAYGTLIFFIAIPVIGIITFIIRRIARVKTKSILLRYSFAALWVVGWVCFISLVISVARDFKSRNTPVEETVQLAKPNVTRLEIQPAPGSKFYGQDGWLDFEPFSSNMAEDTAFINNVNLRIVKGTADSFIVTVVKKCNGRTRRWADTLASKMNFSIAQTDSILYMDKGLAINTTDKFRNQRVYVTIEVPVGKTINISKQMRGGNHANIQFNDNDWNDSWDKPQVEGWEGHFGEDLTMRADGLYTADGKLAKEEYYRGRRRIIIHNDDVDINTDIDDDDDNGGSDRVIIINDQVRKEDSLRQIKEEKTRMMKDSLKRIKEQINRKIEKLNQGAAPEGVFNDRSSFILNI
ncbi:hypothetical protein BH09BAC2_BH09BAC2_03880 [soil metagenome]